MAVLRNTQIRELDGLEPLESNDKPAGRVVGASFPVKDDKYQDRVESALPGVD